MYVCMYVCVCVSVCVCVRVCVCARVCQSVLFNNINNINKIEQNTILGVYLNMYIHVYVYTYMYYIFNLLDISSYIFISDLIFTF